MAIGLSYDLLSASRPSITEFQPEYPQLSDYLQRYLPEYDDEKEREKLSSFSKEDLVYMLVNAYKEKRVLAKWLGEEQSRLRRVREVLDEPSSLLNMPGIPGSDDIRKMLE